MKKWNVTVTGTLKFDREVVLFANTEEQARDAARSVIEDVMKESDEIEFNEIDANEFEKEKASPNFEIGYFIKGVGGDG